MEIYIQGSLGIIHTVTSVLALVFGGLVLKKSKGTVFHKKLGYIYVINMLILNFSAMGITNMTGSMGLFHIFIIFSLPTTLAAMYFPLFARKNRNWMRKHFEFMYWSYVGLIAAFIAEVVVRIPALLLYSEGSVQEFSASPSSFVYAAVILGGVMVVAEILFRRYCRQLFG